MRLNKLFFRIFNLGNKNKQKIVFHVKITNKRL